MKFEAKRDLSYRILFWTSTILFFGLAIGLFVPVYNEAGLFASIILSTIFGLFGIVILWFWFRTFYFVTDEELIIQVGPFKRRIQIRSIKKIEKTHSQIASAALSKERYYLYYNAYDYTLIAPENIETFVQVINEKKGEPVEFVS